MNILVTGATKGIGRAIVERFAAAGFNVAFSARTAADLEALKRELKDKYPKQQVLAIQADMAKRSDVKAMTDTICATWTSLDVLVNNAGVFLPGNLTEEAEGNLEFTINTNLYSAYHTTRALLDLLKAQRGSYIFNICSIASLAAYPAGGSYTVSKFAMLGLSKTLRQELMPFGIRVSSVMPGATLTASWAGVDLPESRFIDAKDVATLVFETHQLSNRTVVEDIVIRPMEGDL